MARRLNRTRRSALPLAGLALALGGSLLLIHRAPAPAPAPALAASAASLDVHVTARQTSNRSSITSPVFNTSQPSEVLLVLLASDGPAGGQLSFSSVTGGKLTWHLVSRSDQSLGDAEIWATQTVARLTGVSVTANRSSGAYHGMLTVVSVPDPGLSLSLAATGSASAISGPSSVTLRGVPAGSSVYAVGNDWDRAFPRRAAAGGALISESVDTSANDTYWAQRLGAPSVSPSVTVADSAPTTDEWNLAAVAVSAGPASSAGTTVPASTGTPVGTPTVSVTPQATVSVTTPPASVPASTVAPSPTPTATPLSTQKPGGTTYVQPGTQGYRGATSSLAVYSAANGKVPAAGCAWTADVGEAWQVSRLHRYQPQLGSCLYSGQLGMGRLRHPDDHELRSGLGVVLLVQRLRRLP